MSSHDEAQRAILSRLHVAFAHQGYFPSADERLCYVCGVRNRVAGANLCDTCTERRERLMRKYPDLAPIPSEPRTKQPIRSNSGFTAISDMKLPKSYSPHNYE